MDVTMGAGIIKSGKTNISVMYNPVPGIALVDEDHVKLLML